MEKVTLKHGDCYLTRDDLVWVMKQVPLDTSVEKLPEALLAALVALDARVGDSHG